jgi:hypothetical protein
MRTGVLGALLFSFAALGDANLDKARSLVSDVKYGEAAKALSAAEAATGNARADLIEIYELQGIVYGTLNKPDLARAAFTKLFALDPEHKLNGKLSPRVTTPFYEAKGKAHESGALELKHGAALANDRVEGLGFTLSDPQHMAKKLKLHVSEDGKPWRDVEQSAAAQVMIPVSGRQVYWYAVLLGDHDAELATVFTAGAPGLERVAMPVSASVVEEKPQPEAKAAPPEAPAPAEIVQVPRYRTAAMTFVVLSLVATTLSFVCVGSYVTAVNQWKAVPHLPDGTLDVTRAQAYDIDLRVRTGATGMVIMLPLTAIFSAVGILTYTRGWQNPIEVQK